MENIADTGQSFSENILYCFAQAKENLSLINSSVSVNGPINTIVFAWWDNKIVVGSDLYLLESHYDDDIDMWLNCKLKVHPESIRISDITTNERDELLLDGYQFFSPTIQQKLFNLGGRTESTMRIAMVALGLQVD